MKPAQVVPIGGRSGNTALGTWACSVPRDFAFDESNAAQFPPIEAHSGPSVDAPVPAEADEEVPIWYVQGPPMKLHGGWLPPPMVNGLFYTHYPFTIHRPCGIPALTTRGCPALRPSMM